MRRLLEVWVVATMLSSSPGWACTGDGGPGTDMAALGFFTKEIEDATRFDGRRPGLGIELVDLNSDGCVDAIVAFRSAFLGGARGCSTRVLDMAFDPPREIGGMLACGVRPSSIRSAGWLDLTGESGGRWIYSEGIYRWSEK